MSKHLRVEKYRIVIDEADFDEAQALAGWESFVRSQGWTPVGEPKILRDPAAGFHAVEGRLVQAKIDGRIDTNAWNILLP